MYSAQVEGRFIFRADGTYNQFLRFINSSNYGGQIIQLWGNYAQQGNTLTLTGAGGQVTGGPRPEALCDLGSGACEPLNTRFDKTEIQVIDANTFKAKAVTAKRVTAAPSANSHSRALIRDRRRCGLHGRQTESAQPRPRR